MIANPLEDLRGLYLPQIDSYIMIIALYVVDPVQTEIS